MCPGGDKLECLCRGFAFPGPGKGGERHLRHAEKRPQRRAVGRHGHNVHGHGLPQPHVSGLVAVGVGLLHNKGMAFGVMVTARHLVDQAYRGHVHHAPRRADGGEIHGAGHGHAGYKSGVVYDIRKTDLSPGQPHLLHRRLDRFFINPFRSHTADLHEAKGGHAGQAVVHPFHAESTAFDIVIKIRKTISGAETLEAGVEDGPDLRLTVCPQTPQERVLRCGQKAFRAEHALSTFVDCFGNFSYDVLAVQ